MWAVVPAAGIGQRIQPIACSKELLPVGCRSHDGIKRPKAVSEYLLERLVLAGADAIAIVISPEKTDIIQYYGSDFAGVPLAYVVQSQPRGLCDAIFRAAPLVGGGDDVLFGLPDTIWFPEDALTLLPERESSLLLFPVRQPQFFDAVLTDSADRVTEIEVKVEAPRTHWIWGAGRLCGATFAALHTMWQARTPRDEYLGTLINAYLAGGGRIGALRAGQHYLDVGTYDGYRAASQAVHRDLETRSA
jgi:glucose-1-phosphate thymidylyltransferase